jgi:hypothetical protein
MKTYFKITLGKRTLSLDKDKFNTLTLTWKLKKHPIAKIGEESLKVFSDGLLKNDEICMSMRHITDRMIIREPYDKDDVITKVFDDLVATAINSKAEDISTPLCTETLSQKDKEELLERLEKTLDRAKKELKSFTE